MLVILIFNKLDLSGVSTKVSAVTNDKKEHSQESRSETLKQSKN